MGDLQDISAQHPALLDHRVLRSSRPQIQAGGTPIPQAMSQILSAEHDDRPIWLTLGTAKRPAS